MIAMGFFALPRRGGMPPPTAKFPSGAANAGFSFIGNDDESDGQTFMCLEASGGSVTGSCDCSALGSCALRETARGAVLDEGWSVVASVAG